MATTTFHEYDGNGSNKDFNYTFPTYASTEVKVLVDQVLVDNWTIVSWSASGTNIVRFDNTTGTTNTDVCESSGAPKNTLKVRVYRDTSVDAAKATYVAGASIKKDDLNDNQTQVLRALQEEQNRSITTNDIRDGAVTSAKIKDATIVNADISATAEVAVSKLADGAARQVLQTATDGTSVEWTSNVDLPGTLDVTGATQFDSTVGVDGNFDVNTNKFTVAASSGNTVIAGTLAAGVTTVTGNIVVSGTVDGRDVATDGTKLDGIEAGATADQSNAEIRTAVEAASDSNVFTDADHSKLNAIEASATADQTDAEIRAAVEAASDSNVFTDADHSKLNAIEANATADQTSTEIKTLLASDKLNEHHIADYSLPNSKIIQGSLTGSEHATGFLNNANYITAGGSASANKVLVYDSSETTNWKWATQSGSGGGGSSIEVVDESTSLTSGATKFTFTGAGVTATEPSSDEITVTIPGTDTNTTYTTSFVDSSDDCILRLTDSGSGTDDLKFVAGSNITLTPSGDNLTIAASGGGGSALTVSNDGSDTGDDATTINFTGAGVTASGSG